MHEDNLVKFSDEKRRLIREHPLHYEYCFIDYEDKFDQFCVHSVMQRDMTNLNLVEAGGKRYFASIDFPKEDWTEEEVREYWESYDLCFRPHPAALEEITGTAGIYESILFQGDLISIYRKGDGSRIIDTTTLPEVTETMLAINTLNIRSDDPERENVYFTMEGSLLQGIPAFEFSPQDLVLCNGQLLRADYTQAYQGLLGFFLYELELPVCLVDQEETDLYIHKETMEGRQVYRFNTDGQIDPSWLVQMQNLLLGLVEDDGARPGLRLTLIVNKLAVDPDTGADGAQLPTSEKRLGELLPGSRPQEKSNTTFWDYEDDYEADEEEDE